MSIAKTTRPHLLTREAAAARIEALEKALRAIADIDIITALAATQLEEVKRRARAALAEG